MSRTTGTEIAAVVDQTCEREQTLRIAVEPLRGVSSGPSAAGLGRALAVDERRLAAIRTWEEDADLTTVDYVLEGEVGGRAEQTVLDLRRPTELDAVSTAPAP